MQDCCCGLRGISKTISFTAPLNSTLVWLCLEVGVQLITRLNLGGYIPSSSLILSSSLECSSLTKKSMSLSRICSVHVGYIHLCIVSMGVGSTLCIYCEDTFPGTAMQYIVNVFMFIYYWCCIYGGRELS